MNTARNKPRILIVDDELPLRLLMQDLLSEEGYLVDEAENGKDALQKLNKKNYDMVVSDVAMPEMDGIALYYAIKENWPTLKNRILFVTGNHDEETKSFFKKNGCSYIIKPFKIADLLTMINDMLLKKEESMANQLVCPNCNKQSYTAAVTAPGPCPYCGFIFSNFNPDKRSEPRFHWSAYCHVLSEETEGASHTPELISKTENISKHGVKIRYAGKQLSPGRLVNINIMSLNLKRQAKVMWSNSENGIDTLAGLQLIEPMQLPISVLGI